MKKLDEAIQFFDTGETKSFNEIYAGQEALFEDMDDVISPKMKGLFESTYGSSQKTHLKEELNGQPTNTEPKKGDEKMVLNEELKRIYEEAQLKEALDFDDEFDPISKDDADQVYYEEGNELDPDSYFNKAKEDDFEDDFDYDAILDDEDDYKPEEGYDSLESLIDDEFALNFEDTDDGTRLEHQYESNHKKGGNLKEGSSLPKIKKNAEGFLYIDVPLPPLSSLIKDNDVLL